MISLKSMSSSQSPPRSYRRRAGRFLPMGLLACGSPLVLVGCGLAVGIAAAAAVTGLAGLFFGSLQASLAATARSYSLDHQGPVQLNFTQPQQAAPVLINFQGQLPAFHIVFIEVDDKALVRSQSTGVIEFETDVQVDFATDPPTINGTARERDGDQQFDLRELYPNLSVRSAVEGADPRGRRTVTLNITGDGTNGTQLDYALTMRVRLTDDGRILNGPITVRRVLLIDGVETDVIEGSGSLDAQKMEDAPPPDDRVDMGSSDEPDDRDPPDDGRPPDEVDDGNEPPTEITQASACLPGLDALAASAVDAFIAAGGSDSLDLDADGSVVPREVQALLDPVLSPFGLIVPDDAAACVAELLAGG